MVFQDPMTSLNPVLRISRQLIETMTAHGRFGGRRRATRAVSLLRAHGHRRRRSACSNAWPHQFSGGMRQRVMLAMGFANEPALILADEPTTALDVTIQAQILDLLRALNDDLGTAVILISHDLGVIADLLARAGDVRRRGGGGRRARGPADRSAPSLHLGAAACRAADGWRRRRPAAGDDRGPAARSRAPGPRAAASAPAARSRSMQCANIRHCCRSARTAARAAG